MSLASRIGRNTALFISAFPKGLHCLFLISSILSFQAAWRRSSSWVASPITRLNPNCLAVLAVILPARPRTPRGKVKVEVAVPVVERWILARQLEFVEFGLAHDYRNVIIATWSWGQIQSPRGRGLHQHYGQVRFLARLRFNSTPVGEGPSTKEFYRQG